MPVLPREERAQDQAGPDLRPARLRALPLCALLALSLGALAFDLSLPRRLPTPAAWEEAASALRAQALPGDAVQVWPPWAERARAAVDAVPVFAEEDLRRADFVGVRRLWLLALPAAPGAALDRAEAALRDRGAVALGEARAFGRLSLRAWDLRAPAIAADLLFGGRPEEAHEVDFVARRCRPVPVGSSGAPALLRLRGAGGSVLHLRAGLIGERAFDDRPPVRVAAFAGGARLAELEVPRARLGQPGWLAADAAVPPGPVEREFALTVDSADPRERPLCLAAWTTR